MATWIEPVYDRTYGDVAFAKTQIQEWITEVLSGNPIETYDLKGCLNLADINRIEGDIQYLSDTLSSLYYPPGTSCKVWTINGLPTARDIYRILNNVRLIISAYYQQDGVPDVPERMSTYSDINAVEENLLKIKELLDCMPASFQKSAMLKSGGMRMLPIRR
jgi:hypothetical protein